MTLYYSLVSTSTHQALSATNSHILIQSRLLASISNTKHRQNGGHDLFSRSATTPHLLVYNMLTGMQTGVRPPGVRDGRLHVAHHSSAVHREAETLHLHLREPSHSQATIWFEGQRNTIY